MAVNIHSTHYRFGIDQLAEATHGWYAAEDTAVAQGVIPVSTIFLLRWTLQETGGTNSANETVQFQVSKNGGAFQNITTASTIVKAVAAVPFADGDNCTKRLSGTGTFESSAAGCTEDGLSGGGAMDIVANGNTETECGLQMVSADVVNGDVLTFKLTSAVNAITNDVVPTMTVGGTAVLTGTITAAVTEADIVAGGKTLIITLTNDTWIAAGAGSFDLQRDEIIAGCDSAQSETLGWDLVPKALQSLGGVVRTSNTVVTITWDAFATYDITATETITVTVPDTAIDGTGAIVATPTFAITAVSAAASAADRRYYMEHVEARAS